MGCSGRQVGGLNGKGRERIMQDATAETIRELHPYELARFAGVANPEGPETAGSKFLTMTRDAVVERWEDDAEPFRRDDAYRLAHDVVYTLESRGTHGKWLAFVDLSAWQEETEAWGAYDNLDREDHFGGTGPNKLANEALTRIARRLVWELLDELVEEDG